MDAVASDLVSFGRRRTVPILDPECACCVHVDRRDFLQDILRAFKNSASVRRQAAIDAPRCSLEVDGLRRNLIDNIPPHLLPFCTQAVVGLPIELLHFAGHHVIGSSPLSIKLLSCGDFVITVQATIVDAIDSNSCNLEYGEAKRLQITLQSEAADGDVSIFFYILDSGHYSAKRISSPSTTRRKGNRDAHA